MFKKQNHLNKKRKCLPGNSDFPWLLNNSGDLTFDEATDIENLLEDDE